MRAIRSLLLGVAAGVCIGFGGMVNVMCRSYGEPILGAYLFPIGLLLICVFGFYLFTGRIGLVLDKEKNKCTFLDFVMMYIGNFIGAAGLGLLLSLTLSESTDSYARSYIEHKLVNVGNGVGQEFYQMMIMAFLCGILVYIAIALFNHEKLHPSVRVIGLILAVGTFVITGCEHCIADMFYFGLIRSYFSVHIGNALLSILLGSTFNAIGALATWGLFKFIAKTASNPEN